MGFRIKNVSFKWVHLMNMNKFSNVSLSSSNAVKTIMRKCLPFATSSSDQFPPGTDKRAHIKNEYLDHEMDNAVTFFSENYNQNINIDDYAASRGMSVSWFIRNFKKYTGSTPMQFIVGIRISNAQMLLETTTYSINEISKIVGYDNQLYFSRLFHKLKGYSPREYRKLRNKF